jgi:hypothetical protein
MSNRLARLLSGLEHDTWRSSAPFSPSISEANKEIFQAAANLDRGAIERILSSWLLKFQPCVFGRLASRRDLITFCIITEPDIEKGDPHVKKLIQQARLEWRNEAFEGRKSGFVIVVVSERMTNALPNSVVLDFASTLASFYLEKEISPDHIYNDELLLEIPANKMVFQWLVGVNYFSAQGDGRWWQDHRIPGGMAFSMNSVGHMVKSSILLHHTKELELALGIEGDSLEPLNLDSLPRALELAMRTILNASQTSSGKATFLVERAPGGRECPVKIADSLSKYDCIEYAGYYDTDVTLPSTYFQPDIVRPAQQLQLTLDFSYLVDDRFENPDHITVGLGRRFRLVEEPKKINKLVPNIVKPEDSLLLTQLLAERASRNG